MDVAENNAANLKQLAGLYGAAVVAGFTLFGAAHTWMMASDWLLASVSAAGAAVVAGMVLSSIFHEWGHFAGAALSGSAYKIARRPSDLYFFLGFNPKANSKRQALWMSCGGIAGSWSLVGVVVSLVPMDSWASAILLATTVGRAVNASAFEVPIVWRTRSGGEFKKELAAQLESPGLVRAPGLLAGFLVAALAAT